MLIDFWKTCKNNLEILYEKGKLTSRDVAIETVVNEVIDGMTITLKEETGTLKEETGVSLEEFRKPYRDVLRNVLQLDLNEEEIKGLINFKE